MELSTIICLALIVIIAVYVFRGDCDKKDDFISLPFAGGAISNYNDIPENNMTDPMDAVMDRMDGGDGGVYTL